MAMWSVRSAAVEDPEGPRQRYCGAEAVAAPVEAPAPGVKPLGIMLVSITSGCSGCMLSTSFSTGIACGEAGNGFAPVTLAPGVVITWFEFEAMNGTG
jgi:hypothetical protein